MYCDATFGSRHYFVYSILYSTFMPILGEFLKTTDKQAAVFRRYSITLVYTLLLCLLLGAFIKTTDKQLAIFRRYSICIL